MSKNDTNYVSTAKALEVLSKATGARSVAIDLIADALRGGDVRAFGSRVNGLRMIGEADTGHIPVQFWTGAGIEEQARWSWSGGYFCSKVESVVGGLSLLEYRDVEFDKWGIVDLCEANDVTSVADDSTSAVDHSPSRAIPLLVTASVMQNLASKTWLSGLGDLVDAVNDPGRYATGWMKRTAGSLAVPAGVAQVARTIDPTLREAETVLDAIKRRVPGVSRLLPEQRDVWGQAVTSEGGLGPDILSPVEPTDCQ